MTSLTTQEVVTKIIIPETEKTLCRYVDLLTETPVSKPDYFVSHVWGAPFLDLVETLRIRFNLKDKLIDDKLKPIFIWVDIFAINQHDTANKTADLANLHKAITLARSGTLVCLDKGGQLLRRQ